MNTSQNRQRLHWIKKWLQILKEISKALIQNHSSQMPVHFCPPHHHKLRLLLAQIVPRQLLPQATASPSPAAALPGTCAVCSAASANQTAFTPPANDTAHPLMESPVGCTDSKVPVTGSLRQIVTIYIKTRLGLYSVRGTGLYLQP